MPWFLLIFLGDYFFKLFFLGILFHCFREFFKKKNFFYFNILLTSITNLAIETP